MKTGLILPSFSESPEESIKVAHLAELAGVDGVFCYDHIWPMRQPGRPALAPFPLLAAIGAQTERIALGPLVARVGLVPDEVLISQFCALELVARRRVIAALGVGDRNSADENVAYGIPFQSIDERLRSLDRCVSALKSVGMEVWVGSGRVTSKTVSVARSATVAVNLWSAPLEDVAAVAEHSEVTWAGPLPHNGEVDEVRSTTDFVETLGAAGASWVVLPWPAPLEVLVGAAKGRRETR